MNTREGINTFLQSRQADSPFLIPKWHPNLETQVMVKPCGVEPDEEGTYKSEGESWKNIRWPYHAATDPQYSDRKLTFSPAKRVSRVGSTWWDWVKKESVAVGFDVDVTDDGHDKGTTQVDEFQLGNLIAKLSDLDYVTLVRSTGGRGLHIYVFFEEGYRPQTDTHGEHTLVSLSVLEKIKEDIDLDLSEYVDVKGVVLWLWGDNSPEQAFTTYHEGTRCLRSDEIGDWTELRTVQNRSAAQAEVEPEHQRVMALLEDLPYHFRWLDGQEMAQAHTFALKVLREKKEVQGVFETVSHGNDPNNPNCYMIPKPGGSFKVFRYGDGVQEHPSWDRREGKTWCFYNQETDSMHLYGNYAMYSEMGSCTIEGEKLREAMSLEGYEGVFKVPDEVITLEYDASSGKITASCSWREDEQPPQGWSRKGKKKIVAQMPNHLTAETRARSYLEEIDGMFRFVVQPNLNPDGWYHKTNRGWIKYPTGNSLTRVMGQEYGKKAVDEVYSLIQNNPWMLVAEPFQPEELPGRRWNQGAARFCCDPSDRPGPHPHFDMILSHLGKGLDEAVAAADWTAEWGIYEGADYLRFWIASAVKYPFEPLPYLFFFGQQGCGKSIFFETLNMLFPNAVVNVASAMTNESSFNGEMKSGVFAYIDEKALSGKGVSSSAYQRIKEWTVARDILIHEKGQTPYRQKNALKFIQCSNSISAIRIDRDDTRIVAVSVPKLVNPIPKSIMEGKLIEEAPFILRTLLTTEIPPALERMRVPHINTEAKLEIGESTMSEVQKWTKSNTKSCPGNVIPFQQFKDRFDKYCGAKNIPQMGPNAVSSELRKMEDYLVVGKYGRQNRAHVGNICFENESPTPGKKLIINESGRLA